MSDKLIHFVANGNKIYPTSSKQLETRLAPGAYTFEYDEDYGTQWFQTIELKSDAIIDLPSKEYVQLTNEMKTFLDPSTKDKFKDYGFIYKRSCMLYGQPGTGKTVLVSRIIKDVIDAGGIVIFNPYPAHLSIAFDTLDQIQPNVLTLVVFEEFDATVRSHEHVLLSILDGEVQKNNVMYLATTNHLDRIPARILRPGRFSSTLEVKFPSAEARYHYLNQKLKDGDKSNIQQWVEMTENFSIDELKESVLAVMCLNNKLEDIVSRIMESKGMVANMDKEKINNASGSALRDLEKALSKVARNF